MHVGLWDVVILQPFSLNALISFALVSISEHRTDECDTRTFSATTAIVHIEMLVAIIGGRVIGRKIDEAHSSIVTQCCSTGTHWTIRLRSASASFRIYVRTLTHATVNKARVLALVGIACVLWSSMSSFAAFLIDSSCESLDTPYTNCISSKKHFALRWKS